MADACTPEELAEAEEFLQRLSNDRTVVDKLTDLINRAVPERRITAGLQAEARSQKARDVVRVLSQGEGEQAFINAKAALAGKLPKADFVSVRGDLTDDELTELFNIIRDAPNVAPFDKVVTSDALAKLVAGDAGEVPTLGEIRRLRKMFGNPLANAVNDKVKIGAKLGENVVSLLNLPRSILTAFDLSAPFRQGALLIGHPIEFVGNFGPMIRAFASEDFSRQYIKGLKERPFFQRGDNAGLFVAEIDDVASLAEREEAFMSTLANKIPGLRNSARAYGTYLNGLRADIFDRTVRGWDMKAGGSTQDLLDDAARIRPTNRAKADDLKRIASAQLNDETELADMLNKFSGRGDLGPLNQYAPILNNVMFSSRLLASRVQAPLKIFSSSKRVRMIAAKDLMVFVGTGLGLLSMAKLAGADVELDPRSSNFGKIRVGATRVDIWAGYQPIARYAAQAIRGESKTQLGQIVDRDRFDIVGRFIRSKLSPQAGLVTDLVLGKDFLGRDVLPTDIGFNIPDADNPSIFTGTLPGAIANRLVPLFLADLYDAAKEGSVASVFLTIPAAFGASAQTFTSSSEEEAALIAEGIETGRLTDAATQGGDFPVPLRTGDLTTDDLAAFKEWQPEFMAQKEERKAPPADSPYFGPIEVAGNTARGEFDDLDAAIQAGEHGVFGEQETFRGIWDEYTGITTRRFGAQVNAGETWPDIKAELQAAEPKNPQDRVTKEYFALQDRHPDRRNDEQWAAYEAEFQSLFSASDQVLIDKRLEFEDHKIEKDWHDLNKTINETGGQSYYDVPAEEAATGGLQPLQPLGGFGGRLSPREEWRKEHPQVDAALILLGRVKAPQSNEAARIVQQRSSQIFGRSFLPEFTLQGGLQPLRGFR